VKAGPSLCPWNNVPQVSTFHTPLYKRGVCGSVETNPQVWKGVESVCGSLIIYSQSPGATHGVEDAACLFHIAEASTNLFFVHCQFLGDL